MLLGPGIPSGVERLAQTWGVEFRGDTIIDPVARLFGEDYTTPLIQRYTEHEIVKDFRLATFFPLAQSLTFDSAAAPNIEYEPLALTGPDSWGETEIVDGRARFETERDTRGPLEVAAAIREKPATPATPASDGEAAQGGFRAVLVGNAVFATNRAFNQSGNGDLFLSFVNWLAEEHDLIAITPKEASSSPLLLTAGQQRAVFWIPVVVVPGLVTVLGVAVWRRRKRL